MSQSYRALVEAVADKMQSEGIDRVPSDSLAVAVSCGFDADTFEADTEAEAASRSSLPDPSQRTLNLRFPDQ